MKKKKFEVLKRGSRVTEVPKIELDQIVAGTEAPKDSGHIGCGGPSSCLA